MKTQSAFWLSLALLGAISVANAQRAPMSVQFSGSGSITRTGGGPNRIHDVEFELRRDRSAVVTFVGEKRWTYTGRWRDNGKDDYLIEIRNAYGDTNASGDVEVSMVGDRVESLTIKNGRADNTRFSGNFKIGRYSDWNSNWGGVSLTALTRGRGSVSEPGARSQDFETLSYTFRTDGTFDIRPLGKAPISGRYRRDNNDRFFLDVDRAFGQYNSSGSGTVQLTRDLRAIQDVRISGSTSRGRFNLDWRNNNSYDGGWDNDNNLQPFRVDTWGDGDGTYGNTDWILDRATGDFRRDGKFSMTIYDRDERIQVEGKWSDRGSHRPGWGNDDRAQNEDGAMRGGNGQWGGQIVLEITKFRGRSATGSGTLDKSSSGQISRFTIAGSEGRTRFNLSFRGTGRRPR